MKYLGIDFGLRRIGLATSEGELASPYKVISVAGLEDAVAKIIRQVREFGVDKVVVGLPEGETGKAAKRLITGLRKEGLDVKSADETLSSKDAQRLIIAMGIPRKKRKIDDAHAAAIILQNYLDEAYK